jgi:hypothetical protein
VLDQLQQLNANDPTGRFTGKFDLQKVGIASLYPELKIGITPAFPEHHAPE